MNQPLDQVILVDTSDRKIGVMDKVEAHKGRGVLHRASSVFLFNASGKLLVQQRSAKKITCQLQWANTCCGNLRPGETYLGCAKRRLQEELGIIDVKLTKVTKFLYQTRCDETYSEYEMDTVYVGKYDGEVRPNPDEVADYKWIDWQELLESIDTKNNIVPWVQIMKDKQILQAAHRMISDPFPD